MDSETSCYVYKVRPPARGSDSWLHYGLELKGFRV